MPRVGLAQQAGVGGIGIRNGRGRVGGIALQRNRFSGKRDAPGQLCAHSLQLHELPGEHAAGGKLHHGIAALHAAGLLARTGYSHKCLIRRSSASGKGSRCLIGRIPYLYAALVPGVPDFSVGVPGIKGKVVRLHRCRRLKRHRGRHLLAVPYPALVGGSGRQARQMGGNPHPGHRCIRSLEPRGVIGLFILDGDVGAIRGKHAAHPGGIAMGLYLAHGRAHLQLQGLQVPFDDLAPPFHEKAALGNAVQRHGQRHGPGGEREVLQVALIAGGAHNAGAFRLQFHRLKRHLGKRLGVRKIHVHTPGFQVEPGLLHLSCAMHIALDGLGGQNGPFIVLIGMQHQLNGAGQVQVLPDFGTGGPFRQFTGIHFHVAFVGPLLQDDGHFARGSVDSHLFGIFHLKRHNLSHHRGIIQVVGESTTDGQHAA